MGPNEMNYHFPIVLSIQSPAPLWFQFFVSEIFMN